MKTLLTLFFLFFSSSLFAEDISDFEIEGMSIGDSLFDYFSEEEINNEFEIKLYEIPEKNKYKRIYIKNKIFKDYEYISIDVKYNDSNYTIYGVNGMLDYSDPKNCFKKQDQIIKNLSSIFIESPNRFVVPSSYDSTGQSKLHYAEYSVNKGFIQIICYDFAKHTKIKSGLDVSIISKEFQDWLDQI